MNKLDLWEKISKSRCLNDFDVRETAKDIFSECFDEKQKEIQALKEENESLKWDIGSWESFFEEIDMKAPLNLADWFEGYDISRDLNNYSKCYAAMTAGYEYGKIERDKLKEENAKLKKEKSVSHKTLSVIEENIKLKEENAEMRNILKDFLTTKNCRETWIEEMHCTIDAVLNETKGGE
jgi:FtsZ-binding cell division protein ZapB